MPSHDKDDYRVLLDLTWRGLQSGRAFTHAVHNSEAAQNDHELRSLSEAAERHLETAGAEIDRLWHKFQRIYER
ncbi:hypothetical protein X566_17700 [Afipia sp. P52-10]|uniref:hypothetical protein n=1 Tax=Afipia sp. P52-10 TaxID=1429916 RepID=UPI0003DF0DD2|nr:hypothetical protein [Afipia sp. P52-10]ETR76456.1 hypothetical protein X566_17700 [Afipia sp. P52-10]